MPEIPDLRKLQIKGEEQTSPQEQKDKPL